MQFGELTVSGSNQFNIVLDTFPAEVKVFFRDTIESVPCEPPIIDSLAYTVVSKHGGFDLNIKWSVSGVRHIEYKVFF
jgi:hypothetical protein